MSTDQEEPSVRLGNLNYGYREDIRKLIVWSDVYCTINQATQFLILVNDSPRLNDHWSFKQSCRAFFVFTGSSLTVCNPPSFEHLLAAVSELEYDDTLDLGQVKIQYAAMSWFTWPSLHYKLELFLNLLVNETNINRRRNRTILYYLRIIIFAVGSNMSGNTPPTTICLACSYIFDRHEIFTYFHTIAFSLDLNFALPFMQTTCTPAVVGGVGIRI